MKQPHKKEQINDTKLEYGTDAYFEDYDTDSQLVDDILWGKTRIYDIPRKYRNSVVYIYAIRWVYSVCCKQYDNQYTYTEKKLIENLLLSDIMKLHKEKDHRDEAALSHVYAEWFGGIVRGTDQKGATVYDNDIVPLM